jgi:hypothetical protein
MLMGDFSLINEAPERDGLALSKHPTENSFHAKARRHAELQFDISTLRDREALV